MRTYRIKEAVEDAEEFLKRAKAVLADDPKADWIAGSKLSGSLRRQSMELTRTLARLRTAD